MNGVPFVSCLCLTHRRVPMLRRAIACFLKQTHPARELVVLHEDTDHDSRDFLAGLGHPMIRSMAVPAAPRMRLGARRNLLVESARGSHVATWDDDDWHAPTRLAEQLRGLAGSKRPACVLAHEVVYDNTTGQAWLSQRRTWENSLLAERSAMPAYADLDIAEDVPCVARLALEGKLIELASPHLYVYLFHGHNTTGATHFSSNIFSQSTPLSPALCQRIRDMLQMPGKPPLTLAEVLGGRMPSAG